MARKKKEMFRIDTAARRDFRLLLVVLAGAFLVIGLIYLGLHGYVKSHDDGTILSGVQIGSLDVSGMTKKEAKAALEDQISEFKMKTITFDLGDNRSVDVTLDELGLSMKNLDDAVDEAYTVGRDGSVAKTFKIVSRAQRGKLSYKIDPEYTIDQDQASTILKLRESSVLSTPVNAAFVSDDGENSYIRAGTNGEDIVLDETLNTLENFLNNDWKGENDKITATVKVEEPEISEDDLKAISDLLGTYTCYYSTTASSATNIETGASHLNGLYIKPGEEVSATQKMQPYTEENGYVVSKAYSGSDVIEDIGGGICEVSTTLYNALILAEVEITERSCHSMPISYVPISMDAAISDDVLDLKFVNNLENPIYIQSICADGIITFNVYGVETRPSNRTIAFESEIIEQTPCTDITYKALDDSEIGYTEEVLSSSNEMKARLWKIVYVDGVEESRDVFNTSYYSPRGQTIGVGTYSEEYPAATTAIQKAIDDGDGTEIYTIISQVQNHTYGQDSSAGTATAAAQ